MLGIFIKKLALFILLICLSDKCLAYKHSALDRFAKSLVQTIKDGNIKKFKEIECIKISCGNIGLEIIFDEKRKPVNFRSIMSQYDLVYKVVGPYTVEPEYPEASYTIVFYSVSNSPFDMDGAISQSVGYAELYKSFLMTQVTIVGDRILFQRVPFFLETHHPFIGDYG